MRLPWEQLTRIEAHCAAASFAHDQLSRRVIDAIDALVARRNFHQERGIGSRCHGSCVEIRVDRPTENASLGGQNGVWLMQACSAELESAGRGLSVLHIAPCVEPWVLGGLPDVSD